MGKTNKLRLVWMPQALTGMREIVKPEKRQQVRAGARLLAIYPEMHRLRKTQSWGPVGLLRVSPFVAVYRVAGQDLQVLTVMREECFAGSEIDEN